MTTIIVDGDNQDKILIQRNTDSFSIDAGKSMETIQDTDYILVQRGEESYRVSGAIAKDDLGTKGEIKEPVAVISPEDGAGMSDVNVYPAAEGITGVTSAPIEYYNPGNWAGSGTTTSALVNNSTNAYQISNDYLPLPTAPGDYYFEVQFPGNMLYGQIGISTNNITPVRNSYMQRNFFGLYLNGRPGGTGESQKRLQGIWHNFPGDAGDTGAGAETGNNGYAVNAVVANGDEIEHGIGDDRLILLDSDTNNYFGLFVRVNNSGKASVSLCASVNGSTMKWLTANQNTTAGFTGDPANEDFYATNIPVDVASFVISYNESRSDQTTAQGYRISTLIVQPSAITTSHLPSNTLLTYTTDSNLNLLTAGQSMTQQPAYTPVTDTIIDVDETVTTSSVMQAAWTGYAGPIWSDSQTWVDLPTSTDFGGNQTDPPELGFGKSDQSQTITFPHTFVTGDFGSSVRGSSGWALAFDKVLTFTFNPSGGSSTAYYKIVTTNNSDQPISAGVVYDSLSNGMKITGKYIWFFVTGDPAFGPGTILDSKSTELTFNSDKDIENFRAGDVVQSTSTGNAAWNETQVWSDSTTLSGDVNELYNDPAKLFDGYLDGSTAEGRINGKPQGTMNINFGQELSGEIDFWLRSGDPDIFKYSIDGLAPSVELNNVQSGAGGWVSLGTITINANDGISWTNVSNNNSVVICGIRVNGKILVDPTVTARVVSTNKDDSQITVDGGDWSDGSGVPDDQNQDQVWSSYLSGKKSDDTDVSVETPGEAFDGLPLTTATISQYGSTIIFNGTLSNVDTLRLKLNGTGTSGETMLVSGNGIITTTIPTGASGLQDITLAAPGGNVSNINIQVGPNTYARLAQVEVNGKILVDPTGARNLSAGPFVGTGEYVSHTANTLELTNAAGRWCVGAASAESDTEYTVLAPGADDIKFTSANGADLSRTFSGEGCKLTNRVWTLRSSSNDADYSQPVEHIETFPVGIEPNENTPEWPGPDGGLADDTYYKVKVKYVGDSGVDSVESDEITFKTAEATSPTAVMSGLRFDKERKPMLTTSFAINDVFTISMWVKRTENEASSLVSYGNSVSGEGRFWLRVESNNKLSITIGTQKETSDLAINANTWTHIVCTYSNTAKNATIYVNNSSEILGPYTDKELFDTEQKFRFGEVSWAESVDNSKIAFGGYLSEVYFVDGQALVPTDFGKDFEGLWGPLDNTVIKANVGDFGTNGFYLPFDPAAGGKVWSDGGSVNSTQTDAKEGWKGMFDGNESTRLYVSQNSEKFTVTFNPPIKNVSTITQLASGSNGSITANGGSTTVTPSGTSWTDATNTKVTDLKPALEGSTTLNSLSFTLASPGNNGASSLGSITVNGEVLVDHNNIGVDDSGNDNHFHDRNFAVGNTSEIWSDVFIIDDNAAADSPKSSFDGNLNTTGLLTPQTDSGSILTFPASLASADISIYFTISTNEAVYSLNGGSNVLINTNETFSTTLPSATGYKVNLGTGVSTVQFNSGTGPKVNQSSIVAIEADGQILVDANIQDTVVDTPIKNYAVLNSGTNGNLESTSSSLRPAAISTFIPNFSKFYFEVFTKSNNSHVGLFDDATFDTTDNTSSYIRGSDGQKIGLTGGTFTFGENDLVQCAVDFDNGTMSYAKNGETFNTFTISNTNVQNCFAGFSHQGNINFGQQPFAASNVTHDLAAGTVEIASSIPNTSQVWSNGTKTGSVTDWSEAFTSAGDTDEDSRVLSGDGSAGTSTLEFTGLGNAQSVRVFGLRQVEETEILINGTTNADVTVDPSGSNSWSSPINVSGTGLNSISLTGYGSYNAILNAIEVNGQLLVDNDPTQDISQVWSNAPATGSGGINSSLPVKNAFDGKLGSFTASDSRGGKEDAVSLSFDFTSLGLTAVAVVRVYFNTGTTDSMRKAKVNNTVFINSNNSAYCDISFTGVIESITSTLGSETAGGASATIAAIEVDGKRLVDPQGFPGGTYQTLNQSFEDWQAGGAYFYDENNQEVVRATHLRHRYGRDTADSRLGIYDLTEQPIHQVIGYEKVGDKYRALRDYTPEVRVAQAETVAAQAETAAAEAQADLYLGYLRKAACMWVVDRIYEAGEVVEFNGKLYRALVNAVATTNTDPGDETDRWEDLGITADS